MGSSSFAHWTLGFDYTCVLKHMCFRSKKHMCYQTQPPNRMESLLAWVKENVSPTATIEDIAMNGYRKDDGSWYEPIPSSLHYDKQKIPHGSFGDSLIDVDLHDKYTVNEKVEIEGRVFSLSKAIIFNALNYHIENGKISSWAESHKMNLRVLPKEFSSHPYRTFCIVQPLNVCNFFSTFRAWLIINGYDLKERSLIRGGNDYFFDIFFCHDDFFANLGTRKDDLRNLLKFWDERYQLPTDHGLDPFNSDQDYKKWSSLWDTKQEEFKDEVKHLWAMYLWARLRKKMIQWGKYGSVLVSICKEVQARPGNSDFQSAKRSFLKRSLLMAAAY